MRKVFALSIVIAGLGILGCTDAAAPSTRPIDATANEQQGGTPPNCWAGYHQETQGAGGYVCAPNH